MLLLKGYYGLLKKSSKVNLYSEKWSVGYTLSISISSCKCHNIKFSPQSHVLGCLQVLKWEVSTKVVICIIKY